MRRHEQDCKSDCCICASLAAVAAAGALHCCAVVRRVGQIDIMIACLQDVTESQLSFVGCSDQTLWEELREVLLLVTVTKTVAGRREQAT